MCFMALPRNTSSFEILISYIDLSRKVTRGSEVLVSYSYFKHRYKNQLKCVTMVPVSSHYLPLVISSLHETMIPCYDAFRIPLKLPANRC